MTPPREPAGMTRGRVPRITYWLPYCEACEYYDESDKCHRCEGGGRVGNFLQCDGEMVRGIDWAWCWLCKGTGAHQATKYDEISAPTVCRRTQ